MPAPITKDYDAIAGNHPLDWPSRFDVARWLVLAAYRAGKRVGGALVIAGDRSIDMLEGRGDLAVLWDIRVAEDERGHGVGGALLDIAQSWAWARGCTAGPIVGHCGALDYRSMMSRMRRPVSTIFTDDTCSEHAGNT